MMQSVLKWALAVWLVMLAGLVGIAAWARAFPVPELAYEAADGWQRRAIYRVDVRTRLPINISGAGDAQNSSPVWSHDGRYLLFASNRRGDFDLYQVAASGGAVMLLADSPNQTFSLRRSPDGARLAYLSGQGTYADVFVMQPDGTHQKLTQGAMASSLDWSPDSSKLAYIDTHRNRPTVHWVAVDGSAGPQRLKTGDLLATQPVWMPDGQQIAFTTRVDDASWLYVQGLVDDQPRRLFEQPNVYTMYWSPLGDAFAYTVFVRDGSSADLFVGTPDDADSPTRVTDGMIVSDVAWSVDGQWLAFSGVQNTLPGANPDLYVLHVASHRLVRLTSEAASATKPTFRPLWFAVD